MATIIGQMTPFQPGSENIRLYLERLELFLVANKIDDDKLKVVTLLSVIGGKTYERLSSLLAPDKPNAKKFQDLVEVLCEHFDPKPVIIAERFHFHRRNQAEGEKITEYVAELRRLAKTCKFEAFLSDALRDRLVCGLNSASTQMRLLAEKDLTLAKAVEMAQAMEAAEINAQQLKGRVEHHEEQVLPKCGKAEVDRIGRASGPFSCHRCGSRNHEGGECRFKDITCHNCGKKGHLAKVCFSKKSTQGQKKGARWIGAADTEAIDEVSGGPNPIWTVGHTTSKPLTANLELNGQWVPMEIDTGAAVTLMSRETQHQLFPRVQLEPSSLSLTTYTTEPLPVVGVMTVQVKYGDYSGTHTIQVVEGNGPTLYTWP